MSNNLILQIQNCLEAQPYSPVHNARISELKRHILGANLALCLHRDDVKRDAFIDFVLNLENTNVLENFVRCLAQEAQNND